jgi:hypothetical protein
MFRYQQKLLFKKPTYGSPSGREGQIEGGLSRQTAVMEDRVTERDWKVNESEEQYSPLTNCPHPNASLLDDRASKIVESLHEERGVELGLTICMRIAEAHDGRIDVASTAGSSARLTVRLPLIDAPPIKEGGDIRGTRDHPSGRR